MNAVTPEFHPRVLEEACEWAAADVADPTAWTEHFSRAEQDELEAAVAHAYAVSDDFLRIGVSGGLSAVANSVALHNRLVRERPDLAAELYKPQPFDYRGEQAPGRPGWYLMPIFTEHAGRLFVRLIRPYVLASQRHADAPRLTAKAIEALAWMQDMAEGGTYSVMMDFQPGDMQFINNYHVLHGRTSYEDDRAAGKIRHLKRLWLETEALAERPAQFVNRVGDGYWSRKLTISRMDAAQ